MSLIAELQRRKVFKVAVAYGVVAWLVIQVASTIAPQMGLPEWAPRFITLLVLLGFPITLVLAWIFDKTPEGLKVEPATAGNKRMIAIAAVLVALALAWYWTGLPKAPEPGETSSIGENSEYARSIAVLPFVNMSGDAENEYFSDGISEEILNSLAQMPELQVAARTSSFSFKGLKKEIPEIARELEVRMVLEGSVRKQGDRVRITAQLIDASQGFHVWSQTYDRELKDIFAIQDEIAQAIASELQIELDATQGDGEPIADTSDLEAYDHYLRALSLWQARGDKNLREAERLFRAALALDPKFAKAWAGLALTLTVLPEWTSKPLDSSWRDARDAAEHALALDPTLPEPYAVMAYIAGGEFRFATSRAMFERSLTLAPSYATGYQWHGEMLGYEGDLARSYDVTLQAIKLDPKSPIMRWAHNNQLWALGRDDEVVAVCEPILAERPDWRLCELAKLDVTMLRKDYIAARAMLRRLSEARGEAAVQFGDALIDALEGKHDSRAIAEQLADLPDGSINPTSLTPLADQGVVVWLTMLGHKDLALRRARKVALTLPHYARGMLFDAHLRSLACEPDFQALARELKVDEDGVRALCADGGGP